MAYNNKNNIEDIFYSGPFGGSGGSSGGSGPFGSGSSFNFGLSSFEVSGFDTSAISRPFAERNIFDLKCDKPIETANWLLNPLGAIPGARDTHYSWKEDRYGNSYDEHLTIDIGKGYEPIHIPDLVSQYKRRY